MRKFSAPALFCLLFLAIFFSPFASAEACETAAPGQACKIVVCTDASLNPDWMPGSGTCAAGQYCCAPASLLVPTISGPSSLVAGAPGNFSASASGGFGTKNYSWDFIYNNIYKCTFSPNAGVSNPTVTCSTPGSGDYIRVWVTDTINPAPGQSTYTALTVTAPSQTCGNNIREGTEVCDGTDLGTCGTGLSCKASCDGCENNLPGASISVTYPYQNNPASVKFTATGTDSDPGGIWYVQIYADYSLDGGTTWTSGGFWSQACSTNCGSFTYEPTWTGFGQADYRAKAVAWDLAGGSKTSSYATWSYHVVTCTTGTCTAGSCSSSQFPGTPTNCTGGVCCVDKDLCTNGTCTASSCGAGTTQSAASGDNSCNWNTATSSSVTNGTCCMTNDACTEGTCSTSATCGSGTHAVADTCNITGIPGRPCCVTNDWCDGPGATCKTSAGAGEIVDPFDSSCNWNGSSHISGGACYKPTPTLSVSPTSVSLASGNSQTFTITATSFDRGMYRQGMPSCGGGGAGVSTTCSDTASQTSCTVTCSNYTAGTGDFSFTGKNGTTGTETYTVTTPVTVSAPSPSCSIPSTTINVAKGGTASTTLTFSNFNNNISNVTVTCSDGSAATPSCSGSSGTCTVSCTNFNVSGNPGISVTAKNGTGATVYSCGSAPVEVGAWCSLSPTTASVESGTNSAPFTVTYENFNAGVYPGTLSCGNGANADGGTCASLAGARGGGTCAISCNNYNTTTGSPFTVSYTLNNASTPVVCSTATVSVGNPPACTVSTPSTTILSGSSPVFTVTSANFVNSITMAASDVTCNGGATPGTPSCSGGTCTVTCNNYTSNGTVSINAKDGARSVSCTPSFSMTVNHAPTVSNLAPSGTIVQASLSAVTVSATASDPDTDAALKMKEVDFLYKSGSGACASADPPCARIDYDTASPYSVSWTPTAFGTYSITAIAYDEQFASASTTSSVTIAEQDTCGNGTCRANAGACTSSEIPVSSGADASCNWQGGAAVIGGVCCRQMSCVLSTSSVKVVGGAVAYSIAPTNFSMASASDVTASDCDTGSTDGGTGTVTGCSSGGCTLGCTYGSSGPKTVSVTARDQTNTTKSTSCQLPVTIAGQDSCNSPASCQASACSGSQSAGTSTVGGDVSCNWNGTSSVNNGNCCKNLSCALSPATTTKVALESFSLDIVPANFTLSSNADTQNPLCGSGIAGTVTCSGSQCKLNCVFTAAPATHNATVQARKSGGDWLTCSASTITVVPQDTCSTSGAVCRPDSCNAGEVVPSTSGDDVCNWQSGSSVTNGRCCVAPTCSVALSPSGQTVVAGGNATFSVSTANFVNTLSMPADPSCGTGGTLVSGSKACNDSSKACSFSCSYASSGSSSTPTISATTKNGATDIPCTAATISVAVTPSCTLSPSATSVGRLGTIAHTATMANRQGAVDSFTAPSCGTGGALVSGSNTCINGLNSNTCSFTCSYSTAGTSGATLEGTEAGVGFSCSDSVTVNAPSCNISLDPSNQVPIKGGNATLKVHYDNAGAGRYTLSYACADAGESINSACSPTSTDHPTSGDCTITCSDFTGTGIKDVDFLARNGASGSDQFSCSANVRVRSCSITPSPTVSVVSGSGPTFTLAPSGFINTPASGDVTATCGNGTNPTVSCSGGSCTVNCGAYTSNATFTASLKDGSSGPTISCGSTSVLVSSQVSCATGQTCRTEGSPDSCPSGETKVSASSCNWQAGSPVTSGVCCMANVSCSVGTCSASCSGSTPLETGSACNTNGIPNSKCCVASDACITTGAECRSTCLGSEVLASAVPGGNSNDASCNVSTAGSFVSAGKCCVPRSCSLDPTTGSVIAGDSTTRTVVPVNFTSAIDILNSHDIDCGTSGTASFSCTGSGVSRVCTVTCAYPTSAAAGNRTIDVGVVDGSSGVSCSPATVNVTTARSCAVALDPASQTVVTGGNATLKVTSANLVNNINVPQANIDCGSGAGNAASISCTDKAHGNSCTFTCPNYTNIGNKTVRVTAKDNAVDVACSAASFTVTAANNCNTWATCQTRVSGTDACGTKVQDSEHPACNNSGGVFVSDGACCMERNTCTDTTATCDSSCASGRIAVAGDTCNTNGVNNSKCCVLRNLCSTSGASCENASCNTATQVPDTADPSCNVASSNGSFLAAGVCCLPQNLCAAGASCRVSCSTTPPVETSDGRDASCNVGGSVCCVPVMTVSAGGPYSQVAGETTTLAPAITGGITPYTAFSWAFVSGTNNASCSFSSSTIQSPTMTCSNAGSAQFKLTVTDTSLQIITSSAATISAIAALVANAGSDTTITANQTPMLGGSVTGGIGPYTYSWSRVSGTNCSIASGGATATPTVSCTGNGHTTFRLTVTDSRSPPVSATDDVIVEVVSSLTANAGPDKSVIVSTNNTLSGTGGGGKPPYVYTWSGPSGCTLTNSTATTTSTTTTSTVNCNSTGVKTITLSVRDSRGVTDSDTMALTVNPVLTASAGTNRTAEYGIPITLAGTTTGGNGGNTYTWTMVTLGSNNPNCSFSSGANTRTPTILCTASGAKTVTLTVTDSTGNTAPSSMNLFSVPPLAISTNGPYSDHVDTGITVNAVPSGGNPPYSTAWSVSDTTKCTVGTGNPATVRCTATGTYTLTVDVVDSPVAGSSHSLSKRATTSLTITPANVPPTSSITSPTTGSTLIAGTSITINASAGDADGAITKVEFFNGATKLGESTSSPYSFTWSSVPAGTYSLTAKATDNEGATGTSAPASITVVPRDQCTNIEATCISSSCPSTHRLDDNDPTCNANGNTFVPNGKCCLPKVCSPGGTCLASCDPVTQVQAPGETCYLEGVANPVCCKPIGDLVWIRISTTTGKTKFYKSKEPANSEPITLKISIYRGDDSPTSKVKSVAYTLTRTGPSGKQERLVPPKTLSFSSPIDDSYTDNINSLGLGNYEYGAVITKVTDQPNGAGTDITNTDPVAADNISKVVVTVSEESAKAATATVPETSVLLVLIAALMVVLIARGASKAN